MIGPFSKHTNLFLAFAAAYLASSCAHSVETTSRCPVVGDLPPASLAGTWQGPGGKGLITQNGSNVSMVVIDDGTGSESPAATGSVHGQCADVAFSWAGAGCCTGSISADGNTISWSNASTWTRVSDKASAEQGLFGSQ